MLVLIRRGFAEPFVQFVALGAMLFALHALVGRPASSSASKTIRITRGDVHRIEAAWRLQWRRDPTAEELANLLREHVREEILYREALALGLDQDDSIVRRRLAQKMEFLSQDAAERRPGDEELRRYFEDHRDRFRAPAALTFAHVYFSPDKRGERVREAAQQALASLRAGESVSGDPFLLPRCYEEVRPRAAVSCRWR